MMTTVIIKIFNPIIADPIEIIIFTTFFITTILDDITIFYKSKGIRRLSFYLNSDSF